MAALTRDRKTDPIDVNAPWPRLYAAPMETQTTIFGGALFATNAAGNVVPASANGALKCWGRCQRTVVNTTAAGFGAAGALFAEAATGVYFFNNDAGSPFTAADVYVPGYAVDDNTVSKSDAGGTRPYVGYMVPAGTINNLRSSGEVAMAVGMANPYAANAELGTSTTTFRARNIATAGNVTSLAAFTVAGNDGVTNVAGDVIILDTQTTAAQNGPYVVGAVATGTAPLTRPDWWASGSTVKTGLSIRIGGEGTVFKNTRWVAMLAADSFVVDTTDPKLYPDFVSGATQLTSGTFTISTVPVFSGNSNVILERKVASGSTLTVGGYHPTSAGADGVTTGVRGTAAVIVQACVGAGTINTADGSTLHWTITNQA